jgi:hypothetical protein
VGEESFGGENLEGRKPLGKLSIGMSALLKSILKRWVGRARTGFLFPKIE